MRIVIVADLICPWCYIGKRRLDRALREFPKRGSRTGWDLWWHPFQLNPDMPRDGMDRDSYLAIKFGSIERAKRIQDEVTRIGIVEEINFSFDLIKRTPNTINPHRLLHMARGSECQDQLIEILFHRYFADGIDIGKIDELVDAAAEVGMDSTHVRKLLESDDETNAISIEELRARRKGINGLPCFIIDDRYAISGAQQPEVFTRILQLSEQDIGAINHSVTV